MTKLVDLAKRLDAQLTDEYRALLCGNMDEVEQLGSEKNEILEKVSALPVTQLHAFERLREKLLRNHILTQSAIEGMRMALARAREVQSAANSLQTYTATGKRTDMPARQGASLSKKS